jgi:hypothetical protein
MTASSSPLSGALLLALLLSSGQAQAQPSAAQKETARGLMAEGRELRDRGDLASALTRFNAADALMGVPTTGFEVAATQAQLGKLVEARETLQRVLAIAVSPDDPEPFNEARSKARALDQQLQARIASLRFVVKGLADGEAIELTVDGERVPKAVLNLPLRVNPGHHTVVARARRRELRRDVDVGEGQAVPVALELASDEAKPSAPAAAPAPATPPPVEAPLPPRKVPVASGGVPTLAYVGGTVALVGLVVGSVTGISAISHKNDAKKACVNGNCPPSTWSDLDSARSMATVSTVGFVVGAIGAVVGAGAILLDGDDAAPNQRAFVVSPDVDRQSARLMFAGRF